MKFYSEILDKCFDTYQACEQAEANKKQQDAVSKRKDADSAVKVLETALNKANSDYEKAYAEAKAISEKATKCISDLLDPAEKAVNEATKNYADGIKNYNKTYGVYKNVKVMTGDDATKEFANLIDLLFN